MIQSLLSLAAVPGALIVVSGGFNAIFFANYSATQARRRMGALVLALVNLSFLLQGLYWLALPLRSGYYQTPDNGNALIVELITLASSLAITALILRQRSGGRRNG